MKTIKKYVPVRILFLAALLILFCAFQDPDPEPVKFRLALIVAVVLGIYDVIARIIPTVNDLSWLSWIIKLLSFLNEFLNRKKRK